MSSDTQADRPTPTVCLTVDFDAISVWLQMGARGPKALSRGEFGPNVGAPRLLELFERHGIETTWFIPGHTADTWPAVTRQVAERGHEIANHGYLHESFEALSLDECKKVIRRGTEALERVTGRTPKGFRLPIGDASSKLFGLLLEEGFVYDSSLCGNDFETYRCRVGDEIAEDGTMTFGPESDLVEVPWNFITNDFHHFEFNYRDPLMPGHDSVDEVEADFMRQFDYMYENQPGILTVIIHPQCIGHGVRIAMLDRFISYCKSRPGARFASVETAISDQLSNDRT